MEKLTPIKKIPVVLWNVVFVLLFVSYCEKGDNSETLASTSSNYIKNKKEIELETQGNYKSVTIEASANVSWNVKESEANCVKDTVLSANKIKIESQQKECDVSVSATTSNGSDSVSFSVTKPKVRSLKLSKESISFEDGGVLSTEKIMATIEPSYAANKVLTWYFKEKGDNSCITVEGKSGYTGEKTEVTLKAFNVCNDTLVVRTNDGAFEKSIKIQVSKEYEFEKEFVSLTLDSTVPGPGSGFDFPFKEDDEEASFASLDSSKIYIAKTEVTYELWKKVYDWATSTERPVAQRYQFLHKGQKGSGSKEAELDQPVTNISWCDAMVWTNAYSEWINNKETAIAFSPMYMQAYHNTLPIRSSVPIDINDPSDSVIINCIIPTFEMSNDGFHLPSRNRWEFAARLQKTIDNAADNRGNFYTVSLGNPATTFYFAKATNVSGSEKPYNDSNPNIGDFAWFIGNSNGKTHRCGTKSQNALGLYDMNGNVWEWVSINGSKVLYYGGAWDSDAKDVTVSSSVKFAGSSYLKKINFIKNNIGFRLARSVPIP